MNPHLTQVHPLIATIDHVIPQLSPRDQVAATSDMLAALAPYLPAKATAAPPAPCVSDPVVDDADPDDEPDEEAEPADIPPLSPAEVALAQVMAKQPEGDRMDYATLAAKSGYRSVRKHLGPSGKLAKYWGLRNDRGYFMSEPDRDRVRDAFPL